MKETRGLKNKPAVFIGIALILALLMPFGAIAEDDVQDLKKEIESLREDLDDMDERVNKNEVHSAMDKVSFGLEFRTRVDSIRQGDVYVAPEMLRNGFFAPYPNGLNGATLQQIQQAMQGMAGMPPEEYPSKNAVILTNRLRLNMKAKFNNNLSFAGRLGMYKAFGDSSGVKVYDGSMGDIFMDGNTASRPWGDSLRVERAYFNYKNHIGTSLPYNFSLGRRPSTDGAPLEYGAYSLEGGSPMATIINWQFDGASLNFGLEDSTGIEGAAFKLCYGVGFESGWGNSTSHLRDATFGGFIASFYDDDTTSLVLNYAHAWDITDGFTGQTVMPFHAVKNDDGTYNFIPNTGAYISRTEPATNIGDFDLASLLLRTNFTEQFADIDFFVAPSWSHTRPSSYSASPFYEIMGQSLVSTGDLEPQHGYSIYTGAVLPMPLKARLGLEYNWGSEYWFNMTGAEDTLEDSKLSTRGSVYEAYYIQPIMEDNFFLTLGGRYYDYEYTGSGYPLGAPVKIDDLKATDALFPVTDTMWNVYLSATIRI